MSRDLSAVLPAHVAVVYASRRCNGVPSDTVPDYYVKTVAIADAGWSGAGDGHTGFSGTKYFRNAALALYNVGGADPTNKTALDSLAVQIAKDFYNWSSISFDAVYNGIVAPDMNGLMDEVEWAYDIDNCTTRLWTGPYNGQPEELAHHDPAAASCKDDLGATTREPCRLVYGPKVTTSAGSTSFPVFELCLVGGRLQWTYVTAETIACACECDPTTSKICATITDDGCGFPLGTNATITVKDSGGATVGTCTTTGIVTALSGGGGSGYTNGTGYAIGFSGGGGSGAAGTFDVVGGHVTHLVLTAGGSGYTSRPTMSYSAAGSGSGAVGTATTTEKCCIAITGPGTYTVTSAATGHATLTATVVATCTTNNVSFSYPLPNTVEGITGTATGCGVGLPGVVVTGTQVSGATATVTSDGSGMFTFGRIFKQSETITFTAVPPSSGYATKTWTASYDGTYACGPAINNNVQFVGRFCPDATGSDLTGDYVCVPAGSCPDPVHGTSYTLNWPGIGTITLPYVNCTIGWRGTLNYSVPGYTLTCTNGQILTYTATTVTIQATLSPTTFKLNVQFSARILSCDDFSNPEPRCQPSDFTTVVSPDPLHFYTTCPGGGISYDLDPTLVSCPPSYTASYPYPGVSSHYSSNLANAATLSLTA